MTNDKDARIAALEAQLAERVKVMDRLVKLAEKQKAYHKAKQNEFPSIEQCVDEDGAFRPDQNLYGLLQGETANGRYSEADWWLCTLRAETNTLSALEATPPAPNVTEDTVAELRWIMQNLPVDLVMHERCPVDTLMHIIGTLTAVHEAGKP